jgi:hypothetical protein
MQNSTQYRAGKNMDRQITFFDFWFFAQSSVPVDRTLLSEKYELELKIKINNGKPVRRKAINRNSPSPDVTPPFFLPT